MVPVGTVYLVDTVLFQMYRGLGFRIVSVATRTFGHSQHSSEDAVVTILKKIHFEEGRIN